MHGDVITTLFPKHVTKWYDPRTWCSGLFVLIFLVVVGFAATVAAIGYGLWKLFNLFM